MNECLKIAPITKRPYETSWEQKALWGFLFGTMLLIAIIGNCIVIWIVVGKIYVLSIDLIHYFIVLMNGGCSATSRAEMKPDLNIKLNYSFCCLFLPTFIYKNHKYIYMCTTGSLLIYYLLFGLNSVHWDQKLFHNCVVLPKSSTSFVIVTEACNLIQL